LPARFLRLLAQKEGARWRISGRLLLRGIKGGIAADAPLSDV
jgi:hypothetical protein